MFHLSFTIVVTDVGTNRRKRLFLLEQNTTQTRHKLGQYPVPDGGLLAT